MAVQDKSAVRTVEYPARGRHGMPAVPGRARNDTADAFLSLRLVAVLAATVQLVQRLRVDGDVAVLCPETGSPAKPKTKRGRKLLRSAVPCAEPACPRFRRPNSMSSAKPGALAPQRPRPCCGLLGQAPAGQVASK
jgi:hypothetical protein